VGVRREGDGGVEITGEGNYKNLKKEDSLICEDVLYIN